MEQRNWLYLLPDGRTAENKKEVCELLELSSGYFRSLVKKGVIRKTNRITHGITPKGDATEQNGSKPIA
jgi:predicted transcriptional regulator